jgi:hypothetical protein
MRRAPSVKFRLLTPSGNQMLTLAMLKIILRKKKRNNNNSCRHQQKSNHRLQQVADYQPGDRLKEGTQIFILLLVQQKRTMKLFFLFIYLTVLNSWMLLSSCGAKYTDRDFRLLLVRKLIEEAEKSQDHPTPTLVVRTRVGTKNVLLLKGHNKHWRAKSSTQMCCCLCAYHDQRKGKA